MPILCAMKRRYIFKIFIDKGVKTIEKNYSESTKSSTLHLPDSMLKK